MKGLLVFGGLLTVLGAAPQYALVCDGTATARPEAFLDCARVATERYQDRSQAILDGYRPIGRDFPAMGEHWIKIGLVFDGKVDPTRPEVLNYIIGIDGRPVLVGLGFAVPLLRGERPPDAPAGGNAWHDHFRTIEDETVLPHAHDGHPVDTPRVAMLHAWIWSPNPDGVFAADNWALPYTRLGLTAPDTNTVAAAKMLSLLTGGVDYFALQFLAEAPTRDGARTRAALDAARSKAEAIVGHRRAGTITAVDVAALTSVWADVIRLVGP